MKEKKRLATYIDNVVDVINTRLPVKSRRFAGGFVIVAVLGLIILCLYNYFVDPFSYFSKGDTAVRGYAQYYKAKHVLDHPKQYKCYIIGGSNSGALNPELIEEYTGNATYSMTFTYGNWYNYYNYARFLVKNTDVDVIVVHLSNTELEYSEEEITASENKRPPAVVEGDLYARIKEICNFLLKSLSSRSVLSDESAVGIKDNGMYDWSQMKKRFDEDPEQYVKQYVLDDYESGISELGNVSLDEERIKKALDYAEQIKELCDENGVELVVICGPAFISRRSWFECDEYYDYLRRLTGITDVYDFSDITDVNANPYNFYDHGHYNDLMGEQIVYTVFGGIESPIGGVKLTTANVDEYIKSRKEMYDKLVEEYRNTGTVKYQSYDSDSRIKE